jgi:hypothetical protein
MIERKRDRTGTVYVVTVACPFCDADLRDKSLPTHLQKYCEEAG